MNVPNRTVDPSTGPRRRHRPLAAFAAVCGLLLALPALHEGGDPGDGYLYDRSESVLHLSLEAPHGIPLSSGYESVGLVAALHRHSWEVWRHPDTGDEQARDAHTQPEAGAGVDFAWRTPTPKPSSPW